MEEYIYGITKIKDVIRVIEEFAPLSLQCDYDNCGVKCGDINQSVMGVLVTLDTNESVIEEAIDKNCNLIIEHHPTIFRPIKSIDIGLPTLRALSLAIKNDIVIYSAHTNFDFAVGGLNDYVAQIMGLRDVEPVDGDLSAGRIGRLVSPMLLGDYFNMLKEVFFDDNMSYIGESDKLISSVAVINGGGGGDSDALLRIRDAGADLYVTGDIKYSVARLAKDLDYAIIQIGHYNTEIFYINKMLDILQKGTGLEVCASACCENPYN